MSAMTSPASSEEFRKSRFAGGKLEAGLGSLRRRDSSWDKKWQEHVVRTSVDMPRQIPRLSRTPCKINGPNAIDYNTPSVHRPNIAYSNNFEEESSIITSPNPRAKTEAREITQRPVTQPRAWTPMSSRKYGADNASSSNNQPHFGAALMDYAPKLRPFPIRFIDPTTGAALTRPQMIIRTETNNATSKLFI